MKRPHRRIHLLVWMIGAPILGAAAIFFWLQKPEHPYTELPDSIEIIEPTNEAD